MKCPICGNEVSDTLLSCPFCNSKINYNNINSTTNTVNDTNNQVVQVKTQVVPTQVVVKTVESEEENPKKKDDLLFFKIIIVIGIIIIIGLIITSFFLSGKESPDAKVTTTTTTKETIQSNNIGTRSTFAYPMDIGNVTLASLYDEKNDTYIDVDVYGNRYISDEELNYLVATYAPQEILKEGFYWRGFEYTVKFNDLYYLNEDKISPLLPMGAYRMSGDDFFLVGDHYYTIKMIPIYTGNNIGNGESATITVIYQVPIEEISVICFGERTKTIGCFI